MTTPSHFSLRRIALAAFGPSVLYGLAEGAVLPIIPLTARALGASVPTTALLITLIGIGSMLSNLPASMLTARFGERRALVAAAVWYMLAMLLCLGANQPVWLGVGSFMVGMSQAVFGLARQSYLAEAIPITYRARAMSTLGGSLRIGMFIGPFLAAAAIHPFGLAGAYGVAIVALVATAALSASIPEPQVQPGRPAPGDSARAAVSPGLWPVLRAHRQVFATLGVGVFLVNGVRAARLVAIPLWADHLGIDPATTSLIFGLAAGIDMLLFYPAGKIMDRYGRRSVVLPSTVLMGLGMLALPWTQDATGLMLAAAVIGLGNGIGSGMVMTLGADHSPKLGRAHFLGGWRLMSDVGATCMLGLVSLLAATLTLGAGITAMGIASLVAAAQFGYWIPRTRPEPAPGSEQR